MPARGQHGPTAWTAKTQGRYATIRGSLVARSLQPSRGAKPRVRARGGAADHLAGEDRLLCQHI